MKKIVLTIAVLFGLGIAQSNAQNISYGVKADATMSNFILSDMNNVKSNMGFGASLGGFAKLDLHENFAIQPELLIHYKTSEMEVGSVKNDFEYWGMEIPVYAMGQWKTGNNGRFYAGVGPYVGLGFDAKYTNGDVYLYKKGSNDESALRRWDFGAAAQVGYEFANGVQINAGYKIGLLDMMDEGSNDASMNTSAISLGVGFRF